MNVQITGTINVWVIEAHYPYASDGTCDSKVVAMGFDATLIEGVLNDFLKAFIDEYDPEEGETFELNQKKISVKQLYSKYKNDAFVVYKGAVPVTGFIGNTNGLKVDSIWLIEQIDNQITPTWKSVD